MGGEFDQKNSFDESVWTKIPRGTSDWNNYMSYYDSCYAMQDGNLILRGIANHTQKNDTAPYLTGGVYTKGKKLFTGGRVEIRAKLQAAKGAWPAIWMLPEKAEWPKGGEIDIMERLNHDRIAYQTTHSYYTHVLGIKDNPPHGGINKINPEEYNIYSVDIYPDSLVFAVNHRHTYTYPRIDTDKEGQFLLSTLLFIDRYAVGRFMGWRCGPERITCGNVGGLGEVLRETLNAVCRETGGCSMLNSPPFCLIIR